MRHLSLFVLFACLIVAAVCTGPTLTAESSSAQTDRGGGPAWGGRRLRSTNSSALTVQYTVGVGRIAKNGDTGHISLREKVITRNSYTPDVLALSFFPKAPETEMIRDPSRPQRVIADPGEKGGYTSQSIKQIRAPETFVDIVVVSEWEYEIRFYHPEQTRAKRSGFYTFAGEPYSVTRVKNPSPPYTDAIEITNTNTDKGTSQKAEWMYDRQSDTWLYFLDGEETSRKQSQIDPNNPCERVETRFDLEQGRWLKSIKIWKAFPWGQDIIKKVEDPDGEARTTTYKYFDDPDGPHYTFLKTTIHPDGTVERHNRHPDPFKKP